MLTSNRLVTFALLSAFLTTSAIADDKSKPTAPPATSVASAAADRETLLETLGALGGAHVYTLYGYIGAAADAYGKKAYASKQVVEMMSEVPALVKTTSAYLAKVRGLKLDGNDGEFIDEMIAIYAMLTKEATALSAYATSGSAKDLKEFESTRTTVYPRIKKLIGIK